MSAEKPSLSDLAARSLRRVERASPVRADDDDEVLVDLLHRTAQLERRRRTTRRLAVAGASIMAVAAAIALFTRAHHEVLPPASPFEPAEATAMRVSGDVDVTDSRGTTARGSGALHSGDRVMSRASAPSVVTSRTGSRVTLAPDSGVTIVDDGAAHVFELTRGMLQADVVKLQPGERFVVRTADAEVEVRGTSFSVARLTEREPCHPDVGTRVIVREGVVAVRSGGAEQLVHPGERWPSPCATPEPRPTATPSTSAPPPSPSSASSPPAPRDELAEANALFAQAAAARKAGDARAAVSHCERLLREHPSTPLAEHAMVERMRALATYDDARAIAAAREYVTRFPNGFAHAEAEAIIALPQ